MVDQSDFYSVSPVRSDRYLWADEKPFTAFGQYGEGTLDARVFEQDIWWVDINGKPYLLEEMSKEYLTNVIEHLFANVDRFHQASSLRFAIEQLLTIAPTEGRPANFEDYKLYVAEKVCPDDYSAGTWLNTTPLVRRIWSLLDTK
jgi:hypothetical protein